ncbi:MAG: hypothetical protein MJ202_06750 [Lentisphaeria bacterium]|nr:hypothetical protein [Lentisphaeria bacterium]
MMKVHLPLLCLLAFCWFALPVQAKNTLAPHNNKVEILQLPGRVISDREADALGKQLSMMIKSHNNDPGPAKSRFDGVNEKQESITLLGYGVISNKKAKELQESLQKMIQAHNRRMKKSLPPQVPGKQQQQQQQQQIMMQQQQQIMMQQQQQIQLQQQQLWMQQQREQQQRLQKQQQEQQLQQQQQMEQQRREQEKQQREREKEQNRIPRNVRGTQRS